MNNKAVLIASGGVDSSTLLYRLKKDGYEIHALSFIYGQKHKKEIKSAQKICRVLEVSHRVIDICSLQVLLSGSALTDSRVDIPNVPATATYYDTLKTTIVPNRNSIFLSIAIGYAVSIKANYIFFGAHFSDRGIYPDCRAEFVEAFQLSQRLANDNPDLQVSAPFIDMKKADIVRLGSELCVPFKDTWSCYKGGKKHCGVCSACRERKRAFVEACVTDPVLYDK